MKSECADLTVGRELACWCRGGSWNIVLRDGGYSLLRCSACGGYRNDPAPLVETRAAYDFYTDYYQTVAADARRTSDIRIEKAQYWRVVRRCPQLDCVGNAMADIGCGEGHLCARMKAWGWRRVVGFEISHSRAMRARRLYPEIEVIECLPQESGIPLGTFDLAVMEAAIEHIPQPVEALAAIRGLIRAGGTLVLTTPNLDSGQFRLLGKHWKQMLCPQAHVFLFTPASITRLLQYSGYSIVAVGSYHDPVCGLGEYWKRLARADPKGAVWKAMQEIGALYGRLIDRGPTLFAVARP